MGANKLMGEPMGADDLVDLSAQIEGHPDNTAPALLGGIVTAVFDGKRVQWVKQEVYTTLKFVVTVPDFELKTEKARECLPKEISESHIAYLQDLLMDDDCYLPHFQRQVSRLCEKAVLEGEGYGLECLRDGTDRDRAGEAHAWSGEIGNKIAYVFETPCHISRIRLVFRQRPEPADIALARKQHGIAICSTTGSCPACHPACRQLC